MTIELFREDGYLKTCRATVMVSDERGFCVDQTVFYPMGGGQPGDIGIASNDSGVELSIVDTRKDKASGDHIHVLAEGVSRPEVGDSLTLQIDWERRYRLMRLHSCMHMLCSIIEDPVTGGSIREDRARLDFDMPEPPDKEVLNEKLKAVIAADHPMSLRWITDQELDSNPELVRTLSVQPPRGSGKIRLVNFDGADLQPCGGTHVASSGEIGAVRIAKIEKKGKMNRRIIITFQE